MGKRENRQINGNGFADLISFLSRHLKSNGRPTDFDKKLDWFKGLNDEERRAQLIPTYLYLEQGLRERDPRLGFSKLDFRKKLAARFIDHELYEDFNPLLVEGRHQVLLLYQKFYRMIFDKIERLQGSTALKKVEPCKQPEVNEETQGGIEACVDWYRESTLKLYAYLLKKYGERKVNKIFHDQYKQLTEMYYLLPSYQQVSTLMPSSLRDETSITHDLIEQIDRSNRDFQDVNSELMNLIHSISHDLKSPLTSIGTMTDWLMKDYGDALDDEGKNTLSLIKNRILRMENLIHSLKEYSYLGKKGMEWVPIDFSAMTARIIRNLELTYHVEFTGVTSLPKIWGIKSLVGKLMENLIRNAVMYNDAQKPRVVLEGFETPDHYQISVIDNGPGIQPNHRERIFRMFHTLQSRDNVETAGIGLTIAKKIVELHGGEIWVDSDPGIGSTFHFTVAKLRH